MSAVRIPIVLAAILLSASLSGCVLNMGRETLIVGVSAPKTSNAMTLFLVTPAGSLDRFRDVSAEYLIYYGDRLVYPSNGRGAVFDVEGRSGTVVIPYSYFVVGNGEYDVVVKYGDASTRARVRVEKWVDYVWLHPFDEGEVVRVEVALSAGTGGRPDDRIFSRGELILTLRYHGTDGKIDRVVGQVSAETSNDRAATPIVVPKSRLTQGAGYYSFEPLFHNLEARDNLQVPADPTMAYLRPPWNWIYVAD